MHIALSDDAGSLYNATFSPLQNFLLLRLNPKRLGVSGCTNPSPAQTMGAGVVGTTILSPAVLKD